VENQIHISDADLDAADAYIRKKRYKANQQIRKRINPVVERDPRNRRLAGGGGRNHEKIMRKDLVEAKGLNPEQVAGLEWEAWHQRALGKPVHKIAKDMGVVIPQVNIWLQDAMAQVQAKTQALIELDKEIELQRTETLLERYMPVALMDDVVVERMRQGEPVAERDVDVPQHCAYVVMELIKLRCKIKGITPNQAQESMVPAVNVMGWLHTQKEFIAKAVTDAPRDVLTLEVENNIDETPEDSGSAEGISGAI
jgi:hypothetical protein